MKRLIVTLIGPLAALALVGAVWVGGSATQFPLNRVDLDVGRRTFEQRCANCHSVEAQKQSPFGPNLARIGADAAHRIAGKSAEEYLLESIVHPSAFRNAGEAGVMPDNVAAGLKRSRIVSLVGYLTTLGGSSNPKRLGALLDQVEIPKSVERHEIDFAAAEAGKQLFLGKGKCIECHQLSKLGGYRLLAPSLLTAGNHADAFLYESICEPGKKISPGYETWTVMRTSGRVYSGRLMRRTSEMIELLTTDTGKRQLLSISLDDIETDDDGSPMIQLKQISAMPSDIQKSLTEEEIGQIIKFLKTLY